MNTPLVPEAELEALLVEDLEVLTREEFDETCAFSRRLRVPLERAIVDRGLVPQAFLMEQLARRWGAEYTDLAIGDVELAALRLLPEEFARQRGALPFARRGQSVAVAFCDPRDRRAVGDVERRIGLKVEAYLAPIAAIQRALLLYRPDLPDLLRRKAGANEAAPIDPGLGATDMLTRLVEFAILARASDVHIEPYDTETVVRYRIDGVLSDVLSVPPAATPSLVARVKVLCGMRLDERRIAQDGRFQIDLGALTADLRVSTLPTMHGEKVVLRVLSHDAVLPDLENLGLQQADHEVVLRVAGRPFGMVLVTGPTGSGKTTTLYALLTRIGVERRNIVNISTIEDPIEYTMARVSQTPVNFQAGLDFANGLRALMRQDPDVIMVGEIRDRETAEIAVRAALVGRMLLSTLHTNDATSAILRLLDMGVEPYLVASTLSLVVAQRLVRRLCVHCRESVPISAQVLSAIERRPDYAQIEQALRSRGVLGHGERPFAAASLFRARGCPHCNGSGFRGRIGLFELFVVDDESRAMIMARHDASAIRTHALSRGMATLFDDGLGKVLLGETSFEELLRAAV